MTTPTAPVRRTDPLPAALVALTATTGLIDAVSFLGLGHVFTGNMTGNILFVGMALAGAAELSVAALLTAVGGFVLGATAGGRLGQVLAAQRRRWFLIASAVEAVLLIAAALAAIGIRDGPVTARHYPVIALAAIAMGLRNATVVRLAVPDLTTTVLTRTLTALIIDSALGGGGSPRQVRRLAAVTAMSAGAAVGTLLLNRGPTLPLLVAAVGALVIGTAYGLHPGSRPPVA